MAGEGLLGSLYFDLGLNDEKFDTKFKSVMKAYDGKFNIKVGIDTSSAKNLEATLKRLSEMNNGTGPDKSATILQQAKAQAVLNESAARVAVIQEKQKAASNANAIAMQKLAAATTAAAVAQEKLNSATNATAAGAAKAAAAAQNELAKATSAAAMAQQKLNAANAISTNKVAASATAAATAQQRLTNATEAGVRAQDRHLSGVNRSSAGMRNQSVILSQLRNQFGMYASIYAVERFIKKLADVRGEFELQKVSLAAILQNASAANNIFEKVKSLSVISPFTFKELVGYTKQLAAFSVPIGELYGTMKNLADVSAGLGVDMSRIVLAYGQVRAATVLRGQELRQFTEAGIPLIDELAKKFTLLNNKVVTAGDVFGLISKRMVSFKMVKEIFDDMTSAGGKFYNMQEIQSQTLKGKMANMTDAFDIALNQVGETNEGILKGSVDAITGLMRNWETVAKVMGVVILMYGTYKASIVAALVVEQASTAIKVANLLSTEALTAGQIIQTAVTYQLTAAMAALDAVMLANPITVIAMAMVGLISYSWLLHDSTTALESAQERLNDLNKEAVKNSEDQRSMAEKLITTINSESQTIYNKVAAFKRLQEIYPEFLKNMDMHKLAAMDSTAQQLLLNQAVQDFDITGLNDRISKAKDDLYSSKNYAKSFNQGALGTINDAILNATGGNLIFDTNQEKANKAVATQEAYLSLLEKQKLEQAEIAKQAEFELKTPKEKIKILQAQYDELERLKDASITAAHASDLIPESVKKANSQFNLIDGQKNVLKDIFDRGTDAAGFFLIGMKNVKEKINSLTEAPDGGGNKEFWEKQKKNAESVLQDISLDVIKGNSEQEKAARNELKIAEDNLKLWDDVKVKKAKVSKDPIAEALKIRISLIKEAYDVYVKLAETEGKAVAKTLINTNPAFSMFQNKGFVIPTTKSELGAAETTAVNAVKQTKGVTAIGRSVARDVSIGIQEGISTASKELFDALDKSISEYKPKYDLYEKLLSISGDEKSSSILAFGTSIASSFEDVLKSKFTEAGGGIYNALVKPLSSANPEIIKLWDDITNYIQEKKVTKIEAYAQLIDSAKSSSEKILSLEKQRGIDIMQANGVYMSEIAGRTGEEADVIKKLWIESVAGINYDYNNKIQEIKTSLFQLTPLYKDLFVDLSLVASGNLDKLMAKTKAMIDIIKTKGTAAYNNDKQLTGYNVSAGTTDPFSGLVVEQDTFVSIEKLNGLLDRTNAIQAEINKNPFKAIFDIDWSKPLEGLKTIGDALSTISGMADSVGSGISSMMDSYGGSDQAKKDTKNITDLASGALQAGTGAAKLAAGDLTGIVDVVAGIPKIFGAINGMHDSKFAKQIEADKLAVDRLTDSYSNLNDKISLMTKASAQEQNAVLTASLNAQKALYADMIVAEKAKKDSDQKVIDDYQKNIDELAKKEKDIKERALEYILGGSVGSSADSWASSLTDALIGAFKNGTDAAQAWGDAVDEIVNNIVKNFIVQSVLAKGIEAFLTDLSSDWINENGTINKDAVLKDIPGLKTYLSNQQAGTTDLIQTLKAGGIDITSQSTAGTGLTGSIKAVTEETADRLASMINSMRQDSALNRLTFESIFSTLSGMNDLNIEANSYLLSLDNEIKEMNATTKLIYNLWKGMAAPDGRSLRMS